MKSRALLIGCQTGGLTGVHSDVALLGDTLEAHGFSTRRIIGGDATRAGILDAHSELVADTSDGDAALVYYSGHGGRERNELAAEDASGAPYLQYIVPTDFFAAGVDTFNGLLAEELSVLQAELVARTPNVTTILDCCHSARMSRDPTLTPKALMRRAGADFPLDSVRERFAALRSSPFVGAIRSDGNPDAIRIVACAPEQSAYELDLPDGRHGALTATLARLLKEAENVNLTWRQLIEILRPAVMDLVSIQRPEIEGPTDRYLFNTETRYAHGVLPVTVEGETAFLLAPTLFGIGEADTYAIVPSGGRRETSLGTAVVEAVSEERAVLMLEGFTAADVPAGAEAHPLKTALGRRPVIVRPSDDPDFERVAQRLRASPHVTVASDGSAGAMAVVELADGELELLDAHEAPLLMAPRPMSDGALALTDRDLGQLARAAHLRNLPSGEDEAALPEGVEIEYTRLLADGSECALQTSGENLFTGDRLVVRLRNDGDEVRYASVFDVGLAGAITLLSSSESSGLTLAPGDVYELYRTPEGLTGITLFWPGGVPSDGPREESVVVIVSDRRQDLTRLAQKGLGRGPDAKPPTSTLQLLVEEVTSGVRDAAPPTRAEEVVRYRVERLDFLLHPSQRAEDREPAFQIDQRPDPSFQLIVPRGPAKLPERIAVRLPEVVVHSNRAMLRSTVRVDVLVVTRLMDDGAAPFMAETRRFDRIHDGDRLPFDNLLAYEGPVSGFLDLAVWVSRDDQKGLDLANLFEAEGTNEEVKTAVAALVGLAIAAPQAAVAAAGLAAVATLVSTGARLLDAAVGKSIGVYRTSLLPHERFGAGRPVRRHPTRGLLRAQDMSLAYEVIAQAS